MFASDLPALLATGELVTCGVLSARGFFDVRQEIRMGGDGIEKVITRAVLTLRTTDFPLLTRDSVLVRASDEVSYSVRDIQRIEDGALKEVTVAVVT